MQVTGIVDLLDGSQFAVRNVLLIKTKEWCRRGESNPRPRDYETLALPLSYAGGKQLFILRRGFRLSQAFLHCLVTPWDRSRGSIHAAASSFSPPAGHRWPTLVLVLLYCCETHSQPLAFWCRQGLFLTSSVIRPVTRGRIRFRQEKYRSARQTS